MAVNTRDRRMSMIGLGKPYVRQFQNPTGTIGNPARQMLLFLYSGIPAAAPSHFNPAWAMNATVIVSGYPAPSVQR